MKIINVKVDESNLMEIIQDENIYVIKRGGLFGKYVMFPIGRADVCDLMSGEVTFVRITEE